MAPAVTLCFPICQRMNSFLQELISREGLGGSVQLMRNVSQAERTRLLGECHLLAYTPPDEHFGIVPLEVKTHNETPIILFLLPDEHFGIRVRVRDRAARSPQPLFFCFTPFLPYVAARFPHMSEMSSCF